MAGWIGADPVITPPSAQIGAASAKFEYLRRRAILDYQMGALR